MIGLTLYKDEELAIYPQAYTYLFTIIDRQVAVGSSLVHLFVATNRKFEQSVTTIQEYKGLSYIVLHSSNASQKQRESRGL